jgi:Tol biopolymer transport system component
MYNLNWLRQRSFPLAVMMVLALCGMLRAEGIERNSLKGTIVFVSDRSGDLDIWSMRADGTNLKQLTNDIHPDADPRFSPDGARILYTSLRNGFPQMWMMKRDGTDARRVAEGCQGDWSPDGTSIIFIRDNQVYVRNLASGAEKRVTPETWQRCGVPDWSPDGKRFALASRHLGNIGIFILSFDGKENYPLKAPEPICTPRWSSDGKKLLGQTTKGHVHEVGIDGSDWTQITFGGDIQHDGGYSPDGSLIIFSRAPDAQGPWQMYVKKPESGDSDSLRITDTGSNNLPDWNGFEEPRVAKPGS